MPHIYSGWTVRMKVTCSPPTRSLLTGGRMSRGYSGFAVGSALRRGPAADGGRW